MSEIASAIKNPIDKLTLPALMQSHQSEIINKLHISISQSLMAGEGYALMARRIQQAVGFSQAKARNVARTEGGRIQTQARLDSAEQAAKHADLQKVWMSTLDLRTRPDHRKLDGQEADKDGYFHIHEFKAKGPHLFGVAKEDCNCRCTFVMKVNGQLPDTRRARDYTDADYQQRLADRMDQLMADEGMTEKQAEKQAQKEILPPSKVIPYQSYDEWLNGKKKESKPEDNLVENSIAKTNMKERVGENNYNRFAEHLNSLSDGPIRSLFEKYADQIGFKKLANVTAYTNGSIVQLAQADFDGDKYENPLQTVYHEIGHAFDGIGLRTITGKSMYADGNKIKIKHNGRMVETDEYVTVLSAIPKYQLRDTVERDLWEYVNGKDFPMIGDIGNRPRKKAEKAAWDKKYYGILDKSRANFANFEKEIVEKYGKDSKEIAILSDIYESTPFTSRSMPFGSGHGKAYYNKVGLAEAEFFAQVAETRAANKESFDMLNEIFPNAVKVWETIVDDMLKAGD
ncbi:phage minor head protein [Sporolactobacillus sp. KGMB 08714]|uniref:phage minor head protein n=1 Tax=Sporolactobacillus sp. KGMB 08714 TaxID=3064704 RepID=UPI002FBDB2A0